MLITLLIFNFLVALLTCGIIAYFFKKPLDTIFQRLIKEDIYIAWSRYILFAIFVVGISGGVRIWELEKYLNTNEKLEPTSTLSRLRGGHRNLPCNHGNT
ncbi:MAG: hypothetical protein IPJ75_17060 [Ignavibacteriales bacterium]|nr:hypothetical protein [Ignavibacteriales bacterium]